MYEYIPCIQHVCAGAGGQKKVSEPLKLELWMIVSHCADTGNWMQILLEQLMLKLLSHLSTPLRFILFFEVALPKQLRLALCLQFSFLGLLSGWNLRPVPPAKLTLTLSKLILSCLCLPCITIVVSKCYPSSHTDTQICPSVYTQNRGL